MSPRRPPGDRTALCLNPGDLATLARSAAADYPRECCGLLVGFARGGEKRIVRLAPAGGASGDAGRRRYRIAPETYLREGLLAETQGLSVLGAYHSHPDGTAEPSERDRREALPGLSYVIVAAGPAGAGEIRSWVLAPDRSRFDPEPMAG